MKSKILFAGFLVSSIFAYGQAKQDSTILTFEEAVKIALRNNVTLLQQRNNLEFSQIQKLSSIASVGPSVDLNASATQFNGNSFNQQQGKVINGVRDNVSGSLNASMNLFNGFARVNAIRSSLASFDAQQYFVQRTAQDVINNVATQYLQVLVDLELRRIAKENFEVQEATLNQIKEFVNVGSRSQVDEYNQEALTRNSELRYVQADIQLTNDLATLTQTLLIDPFETLNVRRPSWDINAIGLQSTTLEEMLETAKNNRADYKRALENEQALRYGAMASRSGMMPSLTAFFNYGSGYNFQHNVPKTATIYDRPLVQISPDVYAFGPETSETIVNPDIPRPFSEQFRTNNVYKSYGLQLNIPLFRGLQNRAQYVQQRVARDNAALLAKQADFQLKNDVLRTVKNFEGVKKAYQVALDQARAAELAYQFETERYRLGVTNLVKYTTANRAYIQAATDKAQAEFRLLFQKIQLDYALGTLRIEDFK